MKCVSEENAVVQLSYAAQMLQQLVGYLLAPQLCSLLVGFGYFGLLRDWIGRWIVTCPLSHRGGHRGVLTQALSPVGNWSLRVGGKGAFWYNSAYLARYQFLLFFRPVSVITNSIEFSGSCHGSGYFEEYNF